MLVDSDRRWGLEGSQIFRILYFNKKTAFNKRRKQRKDKIHDLIIPADLPSSRSVSDVCSVCSNSVLLFCVPSNFVMKRQI